MITDAESRAFIVASQTTSQSASVRFTLSTPPPTVSIATTGFEPSASSKRAVHRAHERLDQVQEHGGASTAVVTMSTCRRQVHGER